MHTTEKNLSFNLFRNHISACPLLKNKISSKFINSIRKMLKIYLASLLFMLLWVEELKEKFIDLNNI